MGELLAHDPQRCDCAPAVRNRDTGGRLSGNATCNRLIASYTVDGSKLTISLAGTTMMACPPALVNQARKLVDLLRKVSSHSIDHTGALILTTTSGNQLVARRRHLLESRPDPTSLRSGCSAGINDRLPRRFDIKEVYRDRWMPLLETYKRFIDHAGQLAARR
jgi:hypothetical protein